MEVVMRGLRKQMACAVFGLIIVSCVYRFNRLSAEGRSIKSAQRFRRLLQEKELVAVLFYKKSDGEREKIRTLKNDFHAISKRHEDHVTFVVIDTSRSNTQGLLDEYDIPRTPAILVFEDGRPLRMQDQNGLNAMLLGYPLRASIGAFINTHLGDSIDEARSRKRREYKRQQKIKEQKQQIRADAYNAAWNSWSYRPYGYYEPYYYGSPYYYGGARYGYGGRYGYRRGYVRPSFQFGIGFSNY
jgi:hypothetical protein